MMCWNFPTPGDQYLVNFLPSDQINVRMVWKRDPDLIIATILCIMYDADIISSSGIRSSES